MNKLLKLTEPLADTYPEAYKILVNYLCKCWKERRQSVHQFDMFRIINKKRKYFMERLK